MSTSNDPEFDKLHRLLALKRYERPPQSYFDRFPDEFRRRQRAEPLRQAGWWAQLLELFRGEPLLVARYALGGAFVLLLCVNAFFLMHNPSGTAGTELASRQPASNQLVTSVMQPGFQPGFQPMPPPGEFAEPRTVLVASNTPRYILDRVTRPVMIPAATSSTRASRPPQVVWRALALGCWLLASSAPAESVLESINAEVRSVYEKTRNSLVRVNAVIGSDGQVQIGSGFFIDSSGRLLTTASVAANASKVSIRWEGKELSVERVGMDQRANVALFRVSGGASEGGNFPPLKFGDSKSLQVGTMVIAMGSPFDKPPAPSFGVIDGFDLPRGVKRCVTSHIRADIPLNPGEGGGPLLNTRGEVIGLLVSSVEHAHTCYALPSHAVQRLISDFDQYGEARYGWLGLAVRESAAEDPAASKPGTCIKVQQVFSNSPASRVGLEPEDRIVKLGDVSIERLSDMLDTSFAARVGDKLNIVVQRQTQLTNFLIEVVQRPAGMAGLKTVPVSTNR